MTRRASISVPPLLVLIAGLAGLPAATPSATADELLAGALRHTAERAGDYDRLATRWLGLLPGHGDDPRAAVVLRRLETILPRLRRPDAIRDPLEALVEDGALRGETLDFALGLLARLRARAGDTAGHDELVVRRGSFQRPWTIGPFGKDQDTPLALEHPPERGVDLEAVYRDGWQELGWRRLLRERPVEARWPLQQVYPSRGVAYLLAQLRAEDEVEVRLLVEGQARAVVRVDGEAVLDETGPGPYRVRERAVALRLASGAHRVLAKVGWGDIALRVRGPGGGPLPEGVDEPPVEDGLLPLSAGGLLDHGPARTAAADWAERLDARAADAEAQAAAGDEAAAEGAPEAEGNGAGGGAAAGSGSGGAADSAGTGDPSAGEGAARPGAGGGDPEAEAAGEDRDRTRALAEAGVAVLLRATGRAPEAVRHAERAVELAPDDPFVLNQAARTVRDAGYLPSNLRKNRGRALWRRAAEADPGFLPAAVHLARYLLADEKAGEAAGKLRGALEREPDFLYGLLELHRVYRRREWDADARRLRRRILALAPGHTRTLVREASWYREHDDLDRALELHRRAAEADASNTARLAALAELELARGRTEEGLALYERRRELAPDDPGATTQLAEARARTGDTEGAVDLLRELVERRPWSPGAHRALAKGLRRAARPDEALEAERRALDLAPGDLDLARWIEHIEGEDDRFWEPWDERLEDWLHRVPEEGALVEGAGSLCVLDILVCEVRRDGSSRRYVHQAYRLLSEEHKDALAEVRTPGEVLRLRTVLPGGESLVPVDAEGGGSYVLPGVAPGAYTERAYVVRNAEAEGVPFTASPFFFQDFRFRQPFLLSRFVLIRPPDTPSEPVETRLEPPPGPAGLTRVERTDRELPDGRRVTVWETRDAPRLESERLMPAAQEYIPNVSVQMTRTWDEVAAVLRRRAVWGTRETPEVVRAAREAVAGSEGRLERARALHRFVLENVPDGSGSSEATGVLLERAGDRNTLYKALLDAAGIPARWAYLRPPEAALPRTDWSRPRAGLFPERYLRIEGDDDGARWVSLRIRDLPFGRLPERYGGGKALVLTETGHRLEKLPAVPASKYASVTESVYRLGAERAADVELRMESRSLGGYAQKDRFRNITGFRRNLMGRALAGQLFPGAEVQRFAFGGLERGAPEPLTLSFELRAPSLLRPGGEDDVALLPVVARSLDMLSTFGDTARRRHPCHLRSARAVRSRIRVVPGTAWRVERMPDDIVAACPLGIYSLSFARTESGEVVIERDLELEPGRLERSEYGGFLAFLERIDEAEKASIVLRAR